MIEPDNELKTDSAKTDDTAATSMSASSVLIGIRPPAHSLIGASPAQPRETTADFRPPSAAPTAGVTSVEPAGTGETLNADALSVDDADTPAVGLTASDPAASDPAALTRLTAPVEDMIEIPTAAPTIGNVRGLPAPCLAAGVQYRAPMLVLDGLAVGSYYLAGTSQSGTSHLINGSSRQDAYDFVLTATGRLVVAIADGLGSRPTSQVGARLFCEQVMVAGVTKPDGSARDHLVAAAARAGAVAEAIYELSYDDISFVAAVAVFSSEGCELARIGDVSGFSCRADGVFEELFAVDGGSINVVAASLPSTTAPSPESSRTLFSDPVVLATDGLANDIRTSAGLRGWLGEQWRRPLGPHAMAESLRYRRQGSHDDRTAVVVWPQPGIPTDG
ncbi:MAG: protein phosphatase 2C domain-containing protein [Actinobacteria bacterium]|nr:protein phosphatase 2C domain-containing protein [Actinomycetota bacterium]